MAQGGKAAILASQAHAKRMKAMKIRKGDMFINREGCEFQVLSDKPTKDKKDGWFGYQVKFLRYHGKNAPNPNVGKTFIFPPETIWTWTRRQIYSPEVTYMALFIDNRLSEKIIKLTRRTDNTGFTRWALWDDPEWKDKGYYSTSESDFIHNSDDFDGNDTKHTYIKYVNPDLNKVAAFIAGCGATAAACKEVVPHKAVPPRFHASYNVGWSLDFWTRAMTIENGKKKTPDVDSEDDGHGDWEEQPD
jgi:hypothetical protein